MSLMEKLDSDFTNFEKRKDITKGEFGFVLCLQDTNHFSP